MKVGVIPENPIERLVLRLGRVPTPMFDTMIAVLLARTIIVATKLGVFEALASGPLTAQEVAAQVRADPRATAKLLNALVAARYAAVADGRYTLAPVAAKWLLRNSPQSLYDNMLFRFVEWEAIGHCEEYVRTGKPIDVHRSISGDEQWGLYQRGMRSLAGPSAAEVAHRTPVRSGARDLLDIGGSHGYHSVVLCRRHPGLRAVVLDLPEAVKQAAPILAQEGMGDRVTHRIGNALTDDLGAGAWDVVFVAYLVHHFDDATNREFARRVARALRPGGAFVIQELVRPDAHSAADQQGALLDLYFALTSESGTWSYDEMAAWQRAAGLEPQKPIRFRSVPGSGQQVAIKRHPA
jgi:SAM-dependent methyltransferase